jgi:hypothetical protein
MRVRKLTGTAEYKTKLALLFALIGIFVILTPLAAGWMIFETVCGVRQIDVDIADDEFAAGVNTNVKRYEASAERVSQLLTGLRETVYEPRNLQGALAEELLESGLTVDSFTVKTTPAASKGRTVPTGKSGEDWKNFDFASVSLSGSVQVENVSKFMLFLAARQKLWYIAGFEISPLDTPSDFVTRFRRIETDIAAQGRTFERDSLLEQINKRSNKNALNVAMTFWVPIAAKSEV